MAGAEKNSMLCPGCRKLISSDEPACPYCGLARPGTLRWLTLLRRVFPDPLNWVKAIIYVNVVFFILSLF